MFTVLIVVVVVLGVLGIALLLARAFLSPMVVIRPSVVPRSKTYLGSDHHDASAIYTSQDTRPQGSLLVPFGQVVIDALDAMTITHFTRADTAEYIGLEPQIYHTADGEFLKRLFATTSQRTEGDIYVPPGDLALNDKASRVSVPLDEARDTLETEFSAFDLSINDEGLRAHVAFDDRYGHHYDIDIDEQRLGRPVAYRGMVAPASLATHEAYFPFIFLDKMALAHKKSHVRITRDGEALHLHTLPVIGGKMIIYSRNAVGFYLFLAEEHRPLAVHTLAPDQPLIHTHEANFDAPQAPLFQAKEQVDITSHVLRNAGYPEIQEMSWAFGGNELRLTFGPALPDVLHLRDGARVEGRFAASVNRTPGVLAGTYHVVRQGAAVSFELQPEKVYQPIAGDLWVRAYRWEATIHLEGSDPWLESRWHKKKIVNNGLRVSIAE